VGISVERVEVVNPNTLSAFPGDEPIGNVQEHLGQKRGIVNDSVNIIAPLSSK